MDGSATASQVGPNVTGRPDEVTRQPPKQYGSTPGVVLGLPLAGFMIIESFIPLGTAVQIGADEGFELAKATLCLKSHPLYTEVWNDQPPLQTFLVTQILRYVTPSIVGPRLLTIGFSLLLLAAVFIVVLRVNGLTVAALATGLVIASPGFLELSSSCMLEISALATALAALCLLIVDPEDKGLLREIASGAVFGLAIQIKLVPVIYLSLVAFIIWLHYRRDANPLKSALVGLLGFGASLAHVYVGADFLIERGGTRTLSVVESPLVGKRRRDRGSKDLVSHVGAQTDGLIGGLRGDVGLSEGSA